MPQSTPLPRGGFLVGGAVRDALTGREPRDVDWLVERPEEEAGRAARALADIAVARSDDEANIAELAAMAPDATIKRVPLLDDDVHDLESLASIADALTRS